MWTEKYEGEVKTLRLKNDPVSRGMGVYEDVDGNRWDVEGVFRHDGVGSADRQRTRLAIFQRVC
jgi:hypothetical protein